MRTIVDCLKAGYTRSDALLLGDLIDVTVLAHHVGFAIDVALSWGVAQMIHPTDHASCVMGSCPYVQFLSDVSARLLASDRIGAIRAVALPEDLGAAIVHIARTRTGQAVMTCYREGEDFWPC